MSLQLTRLQPESPHQREQQHHGARDRTVLGRPAAHRALACVEEACCALLGEAEMGQISAELVGGHSVRADDDCAVALGDCGADPAVPLGDILGVGVEPLRPIVGAREADVKALRRADRHGGADEVDWVVHVGPSSGHQALPNEANIAAILAGVNGDLSLQPDANLSGRTSMSEDGQPKMSKTNDLS